MGSPIITLLTDFGLQDGYAACLKGVILTLCPTVTIVDITHEISPQSVRSGAFVLKTVLNTFPRGTIHLVVVDPGVGTARKGIAVRTRDFVLVGPDNGVFSWALRDNPPIEARLIENMGYRRAPVSSTFHGRDVFAPAAAHLANGVAFEELGPSCTPLVADWSGPKIEAGVLTGEVIHIDRFGNVVTNITTRDLQQFSPRLEALRVRAGDLDIGPLCRTYGDREPGSVMALVGSGDHLEIAVNMGHCARSFGLTFNDRITVTRDNG